MSKEKDSLGARLPDFFAHVVSHPPEKVRAVLCFVANEDPKQPDTEHMHVCSMIGGSDAGEIAALFVASIDEAQKQVPGFAKAWAEAVRERAQVASMQRMLKEAIDDIQKLAENTGMSKAKPEFDALMAKITKNNLH